MDNIYTVYQIKVLDKVYFGATSNYDSRKATHIAGLNRIINKGKIEYKTFNWKMFDIPNLIKFGYQIKVFCFCENEQIASIIEQHLITKCKMLGKSLNNNEKSGFAYNLLVPKKPRLTKQEKRENKANKLNNFLRSKKPNFPTDTQANKNTVHKLAGDARLADHIQSSTIHISNHASQQRANK